MNNTKCKRGDIAMIVRDTIGDALKEPSCTASRIGSPIELTEPLFDVFTFSIAWDYKGPRLRCARCDQVIPNFLDADLHPLRPAPRNSLVFGTREHGSAVGSPNSGTVRLSKFSVWRGKVENA